LSEKQIPRFVVNVSSQRKRNELLEAIVRLCKQGVTGSIPVTSTNQSKFNRLREHLLPMWAIFKSPGPFIPTYIKDRVALVRRRAVVSVTPYQREVRFNGAPAS
jgi:hypothetical protein